MPFITKIIKRNQGNIDKPNKRQYNYKIANIRSVGMMFEKIKGIIADELGIEEDSIELDSDLTDDLGADSLDAVELIMAIEEEFDIEIDDTAAQKIKTVQDIVDYLEEVL